MVVVLLMEQVVIGELHLLTVDKNSLAYAWGREIHFIALLVTDFYKV